MAWIWKSVYQQLPPQVFEISLPHKRPVHGYPQTQRIRVEGVIYPDAQQLDINLKNGYTGQVLFQFDPLFKRNFVNRKTTKKGDKEVQQGDLPFSQGRPFHIEVVSEGAKIDIKVFVKDEPAYEFIANDNFKHVTCMELVGHLHVHTARKQVPIIPLPHARPFQGFTEGEKVTIVGNPFAGAMKGFYVNFNSTDQECLYSFHPRFDNGHVVRNSTKGKQWQTPEISGPFPFTLDKLFILEITIEGKIIKAYVDGELQSEFTVRDDMEKVSFIVINGDLHMNKLAVHPEEKLTVPFDIPVSGFVPPQKVRVIGTPKLGFSNWFQIRLDNSDGLCLYDFYPRFDKNVVGRDSQKVSADGKWYWVNEEQAGSFPFEIDRQFVLDLVAKDKLIIAYVDGRKHSEFLARDDLGTVTTLKVLNPDRIGLESVTIGEEPGTHDSTKEDLLVQKAAEEAADVTAEAEK